MEIIEKNLLKIMHWNCNSIRNKIYEFENFINSNRIDIILLNETKINNLYANLLFNKLNNYKFIHKQRNEKNGAGRVAIILKKYINFERLEIFDHLNLEILAINIKINRELVTLISYYNPPTVKISDQIFEIIGINKLKYLLCVDLNAKTKSIGCRVNNTVWHKGLIYKLIKIKNPKLHNCMD